MTNRFRLHIEYDGTRFCGWQRQAQERTVQQELEDALQELNRDQPVTLYGAGRTDAGVHARCQVAHFDLNTQRSARTIQQALNAKTDLDIYVRDCVRSKKDFHARFDARRRTYRYQILKQPSVFQRAYAWYPPFSFRYKALKECAARIVGEHDFSSFCRAASEAENKICRIYESRWINRKNMLNYQIVGNRFLHSMIRMLVGTMIEVARGKLTLYDFEELLNNKAVEFSPFTAPARGLFLWDVKYEQEV